MVELKVKVALDELNVPVPAVQDQLPAYANVLKIRLENVPKCIIGAPT
jgi:hypothetical protein